MDTLESQSAGKEESPKWRRILQRIRKITDILLRVFGLLSIVLFSWVLWDDASSIPLLKKPQVVECPNIAIDYQFNSELTNSQTALELFGKSREIESYVTKHLPQGESIIFDCVENSDSNEVALMVKIITEGWSKYPRSMMKEVGASSIVLVKNLRSSDIEVSGLADFDGSIYLNIKQEYDRPDGLYAELTANHELYHIIESLWFGDSHQQDRKWFRLNPDATDYIADSGSECLISDKRPTHLEYPKIGYVTGYATCASAEDRAETFAYMVTAEYKDRLNAWVKTDQALLAKVEFIKEFFHDYYPGFPI